MAGEFHCHYKAGETGHAGAHARYIARLDRYASRLRVEKLVATAFGNMPVWARHDFTIFWDCADLFERKNGTPYSEVEINFPNELSHVQCILVAQEVASSICGTQHGYTWALHYKESDLTGQPHLGMHLMWSERADDGVQRDPQQYFGRAAPKGKPPSSGGCRKVRATMNRSEKSAYVEAVRTKVCRILNKYLEKFLHRHRFDHRSFERRGLARIPKSHVPTSQLKRLSLEERRLIIEQQLVQEELALLEAQRLASGIKSAGNELPYDVAGCLEGLTEAVERTREALQIVGGPVEFEPDLIELEKAMDAARLRLIECEQAQSIIDRLPATAAIETQYQRVPERGRPIFADFKQKLLMRLGLPSDPAVLASLNADAKALPAAFESYQLACKAFEAAGGVLLPEEDAEDAEDAEDKVLRPK